MKKSNNNEYARDRSQRKGIKRTMILDLKAFALVFLVSGLGLAVCVAFGLFLQSGAAVVLSLVTVFIALVCLLAGGNE